jgi:putative SOS response-associated peptidase YedK
MCGKFTAMYSWREIHAMSQPLTADPYADKDEGAASNDEVVTYRPMDLLHVILWDKEAGKRRIVPMRWGFPHRSNPNRPDPIHARSETIDEKASFKDAFLAGQRGIVLMRTFNEGRELPPKKEGGKPTTEQWTIDPQDGIPRGFAFLWRRFETGGLPPFYAAVMVTVPANQLVRRVLDNPNDPDPRMPAILEDDDWATWLGERTVTGPQAKAVLRTMEGVNWRAAPEPKGPKAPRARPPAPVKTDDDPGLF